MSKPPDRAPMLVTIAAVLIAFVLGAYVGYSVCYYDFAGHFPPPGDFGPDMADTKARHR